MLFIELLYKVYKTFFTIEAPPPTLNHPIHNTYLHKTVSVLVGRSRLV